MALNPQMLHDLETCGLTNDALAQLMVFLHARTDGSVTWHFRDGYLRKFELRQVGLLQDIRTMQHSVSILNHHT
jgi:hypothetical protein